MGRRARAAVTAAFPLMIPVAVRVTVAATVAPGVALLAPSFAAAEAPADPLGDVTIVDRVVAVVDEVAILSSDVERVIALGLVGEKPGTPTPRGRRQALDALIDQHLRWREVERFAADLGPSPEVEDQLAAIRARYPTTETFLAGLAEVGLEPATLRQLLQRQWRILRYVEERLGPRVLVEPEDVETYYHETLRPALEASDAVVPPIDEVRDAIREVLRQRGLNREIETWTAGLRAAADVVDLLERPQPPRPPVQRRLESGPPPGR